MHSVHYPGPPPCALIREGGLYMYIHIYVYICMHEYQVVLAAAHMHCIETSAPFPQYHFYTKMIDGHKIDNTYMYIIYVYMYIHRKNTGLCICSQILPSSFSTSLRYRLGCSRNPEQKVITFWDIQLCDEVDMSAV